MLTTSQRKEAKKTNEASERRRIVRQKMICISFLPKTCKVSKKNRSTALEIPLKATRSPKVTSVFVLQQGHQLSSSPMSTKNPWSHEPVSMQIYFSDNLHVSQKIPSKFKFNTEEAFERQVLTKYPASCWSAWSPWSDCWSGFSWKCKKIKN